MRASPAVSCLLSAVLAPIVVFGQEVGDTVIVIKDAQIKVGEKVLDTLGRGTDLKVETVKGDWLWVSHQATGWIPKQSVTTPGRAVDVFTDQIRQNPQDAGAYHARGIVWASKKEFDIAIGDYNEAIRLNPKVHNVFNSRGRAWNEKQQYDKAVADYSEAIRLDPKSVASFNNRGMTWNSKQQYDKAIADFNEAIRFDPKYASPYNQLAWLGATCPIDRFRDGKKAVTNATKACELDGWKDPNNLDTLAAAYAEAGDFGNAVKWQTKARELVPEKDKADYQSRLDLYNAGKPYREEPKK